MNLEILDSFEFGSRSKPFPLRFWGCAYTFCPKEGKVVKGDLVHRIRDKDDGLVDLVHQDCYRELLKKFAI